MIYMIDTANIDEIKDAKEYYPLNGVTTNPTIIAREEKNPIDLLKEIRAIIGDDSMLHVQVLSRKAKEMLDDADYLKNYVGGNLYIKVPVTKEGIKAIKMLKETGYKVTATDIFTVQQGLMAAVAGADYIVPCINRIESLNLDGVGVVENLVNLIKKYRLDAKILAESFKNIQQVDDISKVGGESITINKEIFDKLLENYMTDLSVENSIENWKKVFGVCALV